MDIGILSGQILLLMYVFSTLFITKWLCRKFHITPLTAIKTRYDLKITLLALSLELIVLSLIITRSIWPLDVWNIVWLFIFIFWFLPWIFAILKKDFKIIGIYRQNLVISLLIGIISFAIFVALFFAFLSFSTQLIEYYRAPSVRIDITGLIVLMANCLFSPALTEEMSYRGFLLSRFQAHFSEKRANLMQAAVFGLIHITNIIFYQDWLNPINAFLIGIALGYIYQKTGNIIGSFALHWFNISFAYSLTLN